jgi:hypothetical protein
MIAVAPGGEYSVEHQKILELISPGIYQDTEGKRVRVLGIERGRTATGHTAYFVLTASADTKTKRPNGRRLLVGTEHGEKSGWFQYLSMPDGSQRERFTLCAKEAL